MSRPGLVRLVWRNFRQVNSLQIDANEYVYPSNWTSILKDLELPGILYYIVRSLYCSNRNYSILKSLMQCKRYEHPNFIRDLSNLLKDILTAIRWHTLRSLHMKSKSFCLPASPQLMPVLKPYKQKRNCCLSSVF